MGDLNEAATDPAAKDHYRRLTKAAVELHKCADNMQNILMRLKPRA